MVRNASKKKDTRSMKKKIKQNKKEQIRKKNAA
jgi:hypothetical protein